MAPWPDTAERLKGLKRPAKHERAADVPGQSFFMESGTVGGYLSKLDDPIILVSGYLIKYI